MSLRVFVRCHRRAAGLAQTVVQLGVLAVFASGLAPAQVGLPHLQLSDVEFENLNAYAGLMRADLRQEKRTLVEESIGLKPDELTAFRPIYARYEKEFKELWDSRLANTKRYADRQNAMNDALVEKIAATFLENEARMISLRKKYFGEFKAALGPRLAARFLHVDAVLSRVVELQVLAIVPVVQ